MFGSINQKVKAEMEGKGNDSLERKLLKKKEEKNIAAGSGILRPEMMTNGENTANTETKCVK